MIACIMIPSLLIGLSVTIDIKNASFQNKFHSVHVLTVDLELDRSINLSLKFSSFKV